MKKFTIEGKEFECEKLHPEKFGTGACAFRVVDDEGNKMNWVVVPNTLEQLLKRDCPLETPADGHICAFCVSENDAFMIASSINIASGVIKSGQKLYKTAEEAENMAKELGFDINAIKAEIDKLHKEGKSSEEIREIMNKRICEFMKDGHKDKKEGGEW